MVSAKKLDAMHLPPDIMDLIDHYVSEQNALGARYGILAYLLGFSDCRELLFARRSIHTGEKNNARRNRFKASVGVIIINQSSDIQLYFLCVVQTHPPIASALIGFQQPPLGCAFPVCLLHNREGTDSRIFPCLAVVSARTFPDVQIRDGYTHQIRLKRCRLGVYCFSGFIENGIPRIFRSGMDTRTR